jgi:hypothetical protein
MTKSTSRSTPPPIKLKGRKLYRGDVQIALITGFREWTKYGVEARFSVFAGQTSVADGFCYFADAVKWARQAAERGEL